jgi:hypothetical protein
MSEQPILKAQHDDQDIDSSTLSVHHTIGTFRHQAAGGAHNHSSEDTSSLPLFSDITFDASLTGQIWTILEGLGATVNNKPDAAWQDASMLNGWEHYSSSSWGPVKYRKLEGGLVQIIGLAKRSTTTSGSIAIMNLPSGYRPTQTNRKFLVGQKIAALTLAMIDVEKDGDVVWTTDNGTFNSIAWLSLDIIFKI